MKKGTDIVKAFTLIILTIMIQLFGVGTATAQSSSGNRQMAQSCTLNSSKAELQVYWSRHTVNNSNKNDWGDPVNVVIPVGGKNCQNWDGYTWGWRAQIKMKTSSTGYGAMVSSQSAWETVCTLTRDWAMGNRYTGVSIIYTTITVVGQYVNGNNSAQCSAT